MPAIRWHEVSIAPASLGHGILISLNEEPVAFVNGFAWLHGQPSEIIVYIASSFKNGPRGLVDLLEGEVEVIIQNRRRSVQGKSPNGFDVHYNA